MRRIAGFAQATAAWPFLMLFGRLFRPSDAGRLQLVFLTSYVAGFVTKWGLVWLLLVAAVPHADLPSAAAVGTAAEVLPALMVSIFVFLLGSFFVVTQLGTTIHSNRASLLLLEDHPAQQAVIRTLVVSIATLILAVIRPDQEADPSVAAFATVLIAAAAFALAGAAALLPNYISRITAPRNFGLWVVEPVEAYLTLGFTHAVVWRAGVLCESLKRGVRNGDSLQIRMALGAVGDMHDAYVAASRANHAARAHSYDRRQVTGWLAGEIVPGLVSAAQDAIALDIANEDVNAITAALTRFGVTSAQQGHREEFIDGTSLPLSPWKKTWARPLASIERRSFPGPPPPPSTPVIARVAVKRSSPPSRRVVCLFVADGHRTSVGDADRQATTPS